MKEKINWALVIVELFIGIITSFNGCFLSAISIIAPLILAIYHMVIWIHAAVSIVNENLWFKVLLGAYFIILTTLAVSKSERVKYFCYCLFNFVFLSLVSTTMFQDFTGARLLAAIIALFVAYLSSFILEINWKKRERNKLAFLTSITGGIMILIGVSRIIAHINTTFTNWSQAIWDKQVSITNQMLYTLGVIPLVGAAGFSLQMYRIKRDRDQGRPD